MNKFAKAIKAISLILQKPYLLNHIVEDESVWKQYVEKKYQMPFGLPMVDIPDQSGPLIPG